MQRQSGNPRGTVGDGRSNNNNTKSNLNYALKRLGQNNPQNKHKRGVGEGEGARDRSIPKLTGNAFFFLVLHEYLVLHCIVMVLKVYREI